MRILLVEDNFFVAAEMERVLTDGGYRVDVAGSSHDAALALQAGEAPVLAIVDIGLADGSTGISLVHALAERDIPTVICTGHSESWVRDQVGQTQVVGIMTKPVDQHALLTMVRAALAAADRGAERED